MPDHTAIYSEQAEQYDALIAAQPSLTGLFDELADYRGADIVELGAGTGRLAAFLAPAARSYTATDASAAMLAVLADKLRRAGVTGARTAVADHRELPLPDNCADLVVAGWSVCYLASSNVPGWRDNLAQVIGELRRIGRPGATFILLETMGTGTEQPRPPAFLTPYYRELESVYGFAHRWIRADYTFGSPEEAASRIRFFFGEALAREVERNRWSVVPECAGIWWRRNGDG